MRIICICLSCASRLPRILKIKPRARELFAARRILIITTGHLDTGFKRSPHFLILFTQRSPPTPPHLHYPEQRGTILKTRKKYVFAGVSAAMRAASDPSGAEPTRCRELMTTRTKSVAPLQCPLRAPSVRVAAREYTRVAHCFP